MTRMDSKAWAEKARKRKAFRDYARDKFFGEVSLKPHASVDDHQGAPAQQAQKIASLLSITGKGDVLDADHKDALALLETALKTTGLGIGGDMSETAGSIDVMTNYTMAKLRKNWFWSPAFFD